MENEKIENKLNEEIGLDENNKKEVDLNNPEDYKKVRNKLYKRAVVWFVMGIAFYQVLLILAKLLGIV